MKRQCVECLEHKEFSGRCRSVCKDCMQRQKTIRTKERKLAAIAYKGGECVHCGYKDIRYPAVFEFHHVNPKEKEFAIGSGLLRKWTKLVKELDKCILLCANCHRIQHTQDS